MLLIKQAQIADGTGKPLYRSDILIDGAKISAIGNFPQKKADTVIEGLGLIASPGFIDVNSNSDHYLSLFTNPSQKDFLLQGVTTIIGGQCGSSLAPLLYGSLISVSRWINTDLVNVDWHTTAEFFKVLKRLKLGVNFGTLTGHSTIRRDLAGDEIRDLTQSEMDVFSKILEQSIKEGSLGLSTGLGYNHGKHVPFSEIKNFAKIAANRDKVYATHLRDEKENLVKSVNETVMAAQETGAKTIISHFRPLKGFENQFSEALNLIEKNLVKANVYYDVSPASASFIPIYALLPEWAKGALVTMMKNIQDGDARKKITEEISKIDLGEYVIADARGLDFLAGKPLSELAKERNKGAAETLLELMEETKFRTMLAIPDINTSVLRKIMLGNRSLIGSNSASLPEKNLRFTNEDASLAFKKYLEIAEEEKMPVEEAIKKITALPAQIFGIKSRGLIKEGYFADLTLMKSDNSAAYVLVNGKLAVKNGEFTNELGGEPI